MMILCGGFLFFALFTTFFISGLARREYRRHQFPRSLLLLTIHTTIYFVINRYAGLHPMDDDNLFFAFWVTLLGIHATVIGYYLVLRVVRPNRVKSKNKVKREELLPTSGISLDDLRSGDYQHERYHVGEDGELLDRD